MSDEVIKNPKRPSKYEVPPYVPEYKQRNLHPTVMKLGRSNPQHYLEEFVEYDPNQQVFNAMDGEVLEQNQKIASPRLPQRPELVDDLFDNNELLSKYNPNLPLTLPPSLARQQKPPAVALEPEENFTNATVYQTNPILQYPKPSTPPITENHNSPKIGEYILMVQDQVLLTGVLQKVEERVRMLVYGEDQEFSNVKNEDIVVLKRVGLKIGVFVGE